MYSLHTRYEGNVQSCDIQARRAISRVNNYKLVCPVGTLNCKHASSEIQSIQTSLALRLLKDVQLR
jgi:hypothetical protein